MPSKTDVSDARWIAQVAQHGLVSPSFVPPPRIRRLRDLTRQRTSLVRERSRALNRLEKVLEDAGIKTSLVLTKTLSMSSRAMFEALIAGERDPVVLADLAVGKARSKMTDLREALTGRFEDHHAFLTSQALAHIDAIDAQIAAFDQRIDAETAPLRRQRDLLVTIPGVSTRLAQVVIAETGADMTRFSTAAALASWSGVAPGNNRSAGRSYSGATTHGNVWLKGALGDAAAGLLRVRESVIVLHAMRWPDEVRDPSELYPPATDVSDAEVDEAVELIERMAVDRLEGPDFVDHYTEALEKVIEAKREDRELPEAPEPEKPPGKVLDLMAALQESVEKAKASRGEDTDTEAQVHEIPAKKPAAKAPAKKTVAKKTTAKKAAARKPRRSA
ncbi:Transposase [Streptomyces sp. Ag109_O5-10]|nr:Transposase [Streptomyces sp. Ag109_O5-10]